MPDICTFGRIQTWNSRKKKESSQKSSLTLSFYPNNWKNTELLDWLIVFYDLSAIFQPCNSSDYLVYDRLWNFEVCLAALTNLFRRNPEKTLKRKKGELWENSNLSISRKIIINEFLRTFLKFSILFYFIW